MYNDYDELKAIEDPAVRAYIQRCREAPFWYVFALFFLIVGSVELEMYDMIRKEEYAREQVKEFWADLHHPKQIRH